MRQIFTAFLKRAESGQSLVETALVVPILVLLLMGVIEFGYLGYYAIAVQNAAHAGAVYGMYNVSNAGSTSGIQAAARSEVPELGTGLTVTSNVKYVCQAAISGTQYASPTDAATACGASPAYTAIIVVNTSATVKPPIDAPGSTGYILTGNSAIEVQQ